MNEQDKLKALRFFLRVYGALSLAIFVPLCLGIVLQSSMLAEGGLMNWTIWNGVICGGSRGLCYVPPMLFIIYIVWAVFLFLAARDPQGYASFLDFTVWANLLHGAIMVIEALSDLHRYWSKFLTDIPFVTLLAIGIYLLRPSSPRKRDASVSAPG